MSIKLTTKRNKILHILQKHHGTLSAGEIHKRLPDIDLVTIYRNLDLFVKEKLIRKISLGTEEARYEFQDEPHHHAVCTECKKVLHFTAPDEQLKKLLGIENFLIDDIEVTVKGVCRKRNNEH